ncbi:MAG: DUF4292 domain-containing protein [Deltaproteobacteria bacterium]|nr:DUF4292 domain-containing protein [Deltaproteobacteria bacterium]
MAVFTALCYLLGACGPLPGGVQIGRPPEVAQVKASLEARRLAVQNFVMQGEVQIESPEGEMIGDHLIRGAYPDRLRAEIMGPFGRPLLLLVHDAGRLTVIAYRENRVYVGPASRRNLARFLGLALEPTQVYALLTGSAPYLAGSVEEVSMAAPGQVRLTLAEPALGIKETLVANLTNYAVREAWLAQRDGGYSLTCQFSDFMPFLSWAYPRTLSVEDGEDRKLKLINDTLTLNGPLDGRVFEVSPPAGLEVRWLP